MADRAATAHSAQAGEGGWSTSGEQHGSEVPDRGADSIDSGVGRGSVDNL